MSAENEVIMEVADPKDRLARLQSQELEIGSQLSANQYAEMLLGLLVQGRFIQAKHCYSRSNQRFPEFPLAKQIWTFGEHICKQNFALALKILKNMELFEPTLQLYIDELKKRLVAEQLQHIAGTYSSINTFKFSQLLGSPDSLDEVMPLCLWTLTDDHFVLPVNNAQLSRTLSALSNPSFGPAISKAGSHQADNQKREIDSLAQLASCSTFFDAMSTKAAFASNAANANNPIN